MRFAVCYSKNHAKHDFIKPFATRRLLLHSSGIKTFLKFLLQNVWKKNILFIFVSQFDTKTSINLI
ncbi:MAG TPA: hypothetical protein DCF33_09975 [Saprospirales bacterium]|nr:hypothetical protein [Saprospirales bacterium]